MTKNTKASSSSHKNKTADILSASGLPLIYKVSEAKIELPQSKRQETVRTHVNSLTVFQKEAVVSSRLSGDTWRLASDEGKYLLGHDAAPAPLAYFTVGMVASYMTELLALAAARKIDTSDVKLVLDNYYQMNGSMKKGTMIAGADNIDLDVQVSSAADRETLKQLAIDAVAASPLNGLVRAEKESLFTLTHNGKVLEPTLASQMGNAALVHNVSDTHPASAEGNWSEILVKGGDTLKLETSDATSGLSLADDQNRRLHLRGICTVREDGIKVIEQHLYNPHGSIYYFLSDEGQNGKGRAPNAATYISAGIGFCFMTQFGRFAKMNNSALTGYGITQDSHFSLGGGSGKTGKAGEADPLETHVYLQSTEGDEFARNILDVSERTCFLHAMCRTDLRTKVKLTIV